MADKIDITIKRPPASSRRGTAHRKKSPLLGQRRGLHELGRRRKKGGLINFYDLGQLSDGSDISFLVMPDVIISGGLVIESFDAHWTDLIDLIFTNPPETWKTSYKKLGFEDAERYAVDIFDNDTGNTYPAARNDSRLDANGVIVAGTKWKPTGLELPSSVINFGVVSNGAFNFFDNGEFVKITNSPTFGSPGVAFSLAKQADFFLMPYMVGYSGAGSSGADSEELVGRFASLKRSVWLNRSFSDTGFPALSLGSEAFSPADIATFLADAKAPSRDFLITGGVITEVSPALFPSYPSSFLQIVGSPETTLPEGTFLGAVSQGGAMFYFWRLDIGGSVITRNILIN